jgi:molybdate transport system ATP-binding protein
VSLAVDVEKDLGGFRIAAAFASTGRLTALFGRSGAGKTTVVNLIAGLTRPDRGRIAVDGTVLTDTAAGLNVPVHRRRIGYVFQEGRLFPHLSVRGNLAYGARRTVRGERWASFAATVDLLGIGALLDRRPAALSGGEKQRVAIGRALLASPRLLLMDEPLAALDEARKAELLPYVERLRDEMRLPIVYVSHSLDEVARLADTLVLLDDGRVAAAGPVNAILTRADLRGLTGRAEAGVVLSARVAGSDAAAGLTVLDHPAGRLFLPLVDRPAGSPVRLLVHARDVALAVGPPGRLSIRNRLAATVTAIVPGAPPSVEVHLDAGGEVLIAAITAEAVAELALAPGLPVTALIKSMALDRLGFRGPAEPE